MYEGLSLLFFWPTEAPKAGSDRQKQQTTSLIRIPLRPFFSKQEEEQKFEIRSEMTDSVPPARAAFSELFRRAVEDSL